MSDMKLESVFLFDQFQNCASRTANESFDFDRRLAVAALGLIGEAAEVSEAVKKYMGHGHELNREKLIDEAGDVLWYVAELCTVLGVDMSDVATGNVEKLRKRYPMGFSSERSVNRGGEP